MNNKAIHDELSDLYKFLDDSYVSSHQKLLSVETASSRATPFAYPTALALAMALISNSLAARGGEGGLAGNTVSPAKIVGSQHDPMHSTTGGAANALEHLGELNDMFRWYRETGDRQKLLQELAAKFPEGQQIKVVSDKWSWTKGFGQADAYPESTDLLYDHDQKEVFHIVGTGRPALSGAGRRPLSQSDAPVQGPPEQFGPAVPEKAPTEPGLIPDVKFPKQEAEPNPGQSQPEVAPIQGSGQGEPNEEGFFANPGNTYAGPSHSGGEPLPPSSGPVQGPIAPPNVTASASLAPAVPLTTSSDKGGGIEDYAIAAATYSGPTDSNGNPSSEGSMPAKGVSTAPAATASTPSAPDAQSTTTSDKGGGKDAGGGGSKGDGGGGSGGGGRPEHFSKAGF